MNEDNGSISHTQFALTVLVHLCASGVKAQKNMKRQGMGANVMSFSLALALRKLVGLALDVSGMC
jgi:hypothetical protein